MSSTYIETPILYDSSLELLSINLPTNISKTIKHLPFNDHDFVPAITRTTDEFGDSLSKAGDFYSFQDPEKSIIKKISYRVINGGTSVVFTPIIFGNSFGWKLNSIQFNLPSILLPNCITISQESSDFLVVDLLLDINVFITLRIPVNSFFQNENKLQYSTLYQWCHYSIPYSFDSRKPLHIQALNHLNLIIPLKDGGLLKFTRDTAFGNALVIPFTDSSYVDKFTFSFFGSRKKENEDGIPDVIDLNGTDKVSTRAVLDLVAQENSLITISIDKSIKIWNLNETRLIRKLKLNDHLPKSLHRLLFNLKPTSLLSLVNNTLVVFLPIEPKIIKIFSITDDLSLDEQQSILPDIKPEWHFHSYKVLKIDDSCKIWISWCFNKARLLQQVDVSSDGTLTWNEVYDNSELTNSLDNEFIQLQSGGFEQVGSIVQQNLQN
ncbi:unnamed protein product [Ambrosiozyma monospora]|uniref:Unnamed protein product n=1 Tax=Ambrosiozyma monospora TaxID=43982 RepID=A0ACB5SSX6_AMBMO|nr:unnamed protein product [Ambrosiozyma monospora]